MMKKRILFVSLLCLAAVISFASCDQATDNIPSQETTNEETSVLSDHTEPADTAADTDSDQVFDWNISTDSYTIQNVNGVCYMTFQDGYVATDSELQSCQSMEIYFDSIRDMVLAFTNDTLTRAQEIVIQSSFPSTEHGYSLWNTEALFDARTPDGIEVTSVALHGEYYDLFLMGEGIARGTVSYNSEEYIQWSKDLLYTWSEGATVIRQEASAFDGVPCELVEYRNSAETYRDMYIETEAEGKKMNMVIRYLLEDQRKNPERVSDTAPLMVLIYGEDNGIHYSISLDELTEAPTYAWLSTFGLTAYNPSADNSQPTE